MKPFVNELAMTYDINKYQIYLLHNDDHTPSMLVYQERTFCHNPI